MTLLKNFVAPAALLTGILTGASASPVTFFGQDVYTTASQIAHPNSDAARTSFLSNLTGVGTESFESLTPGASPPIALAFQGAGTATLNGSGSVSGTPSSGAYAISGTHYYFASANNNASFNIAFSSPVAAFGFYGVDIGDFGATVALSLTDINNVKTTVNIPYTKGTSGSTSGSVLYFGFYDQTDEYTNIAFLTTSAGQTDTFGFDDMTIGSRTQVTASVPEPSSLGLLSAAFVGAVFASRRRART